MILKNHTHDRKIEEQARPPQKHMYRRAVVCVALLVMVGCSGGAGTEKSGEIASRKIKVLATTGMIADLAINVGGDRVTVDALMGPGVDPHLYKASEGDVQRMASADIILYNGLHLEGAMAEVFERMESRVTTVAVTDRIDRAKLHAPPAFKGNYDPHVWFDVKLWMNALETVHEAFVKLDSTHAAQYDANTRRYRDSLDALHQYVLSRAQTLPAERRVLVTAHDAFGYFGEAYGFEVHGLQGISTVTEAGTADVTQLADFIATRRIPAIFVESSVPTRSIEAVRAAVRARGFEVKIGGELFSDAMGTAGTPEGTYPGMVRHNIDVIVTALSNGEI
jgi:manganese/zinc/iron transport system substrate-binding protein